MGTGAVLGLWTRAATSSGLDRLLDEAHTLVCFDHRPIIKVHRFFAAHGRRITANAQT